MGTGPSFCPIKYAVNDATTIRGIAPRNVVAFTGWAIMVFWEVVALPLTLPLVRALKRHEGVDYFDIGTNFNPLFLISRVPLGGQRPAPRSPRYLVSACAMIPLPAAGFILCFLIAIVSG